jgi:hypothetical protein
MRAVIAGLSGTVGFGPVYTIGGRTRDGKAHRARFESGFVEIPASVAPALEMGRQSHYLS